LRVRHRIVTDVAYPGGMRTLAIASVLVVACAAACSKSEGPVRASGAGSAGGNIDIQGAGATFPYPLYSKWVAEYQKRNPRVRVNYQSIGSGGGIKQILERTVDFGASDAPMNDGEMAKVQGRLLHVPSTLGAVVLAYYLPGVESGLKLTPETVAGIFLGEITKWNDPKLAADNPGVALPGDAITVAYRSDGSGTTAVFTDYLAAVSPAWKEKVGAGKSVKFPIGMGAKGNEGVAGQVKTTPGTIGYVELAYARQTGLSYAAVKNAAGKSVSPSPESVSAAAAGFAARMPEDLRRNIVNPDGEDAYPISAFTYLLVYADMPEGEKTKALVDFLWWALHDGQKLGVDMDYAPLPAEVVTRAEAALKSITAGGKPVL
jgi:phosphate transport system substrate-binding protein